MMYSTAQATSATNILVVWLCCSLDMIATTLLWFLIFSMWTSLLRPIHFCKGDDNQRIMKIGTPLFLFAALLSASVKGDKPFSRIVVNVGYK